MIEFPVRILSKLEQGATVRKEGQEPQQVRHFTIGLGPIADLAEVPASFKGELHTLDPETAAQFTVGSIGIVRLLPEVPLGDDLEPYPDGGPAGCHRQSGNIVLARN
jgi:hypothetical protein